MQTRIPRVLLELAMLALAVSCVLGLQFLANSVLFYWTLGSIENVLHANLGLSEAWSGVVAPLLTILYLWASWRALSFFWIRGQTIEAGIGLVVFLAFFPLLHIFDAKFNRKTGAAQVCALLRPDGTTDIYSRDSNGSCPYSDLGILTVPLTADLDCFEQRQHDGIRPIPFRGDPLRTDFIDPETGKSRLLYYREMDGGFRLFETGKYYSCSGDFLRPVTPQIRQEIVGQITAAQSHRDEVAREEARKKLSELFGSPSYPKGAVIVGAKAQQDGDDTSSQAADYVQAELVAALRRRNIDTAELRPAAKESSYFDAILNGQSTVLDDAGVTANMRAAVFVLVNASCAPAEYGLTSCKITVTVSTLKPHVSQVQSTEASATGPGFNEGAALARAAEMIVDRYPGLLSGV